MKLKEKLALEAIDKIVLHGDMSTPYVAWIDGFQTALEIAQTHLLHDVHHEETLYEKACLLHMFGEKELS